MYRLLSILLIALATIGCTAEKTITVPNVRMEIVEEVKSQFKVIEERMFNSSRMTPEESGKFLKFLETYDPNKVTITQEERGLLLGMTKLAIALEEIVAAGEKGRFDLREMKVNEYLQARGEIVKILGFSPSSFSYRTFLV